MYGIINPINQSFLSLLKVQLKGHFDRFLNSKFMKARERAARSAAQRAIGHKTFKELSLLSDRELNDIGINRSMIYSISYGDK